MKAASVQAVVRALNDRGVPFIVVGGLAVVAHGYGRLTHDMDLVIRLTAENIESAFGALGALGYRPTVPVTAGQFADAAQRRRWIEEKGMTVLNFQSDAHRETPIDVFVEEPFDFDEEHRRALVQEVAPGVAVRILRLATLLKMKDETGRLVDRADAAELRLLHGEDE